MIRFRPSLLSLGLLVAACASVLAMDPPHNISVANKYGSLNYCSACHKFHGSTGGALTTVQGNANVCLSCHVSGGSAQLKALVASDQAVPAGLVGATAGGTSHRWDSGPQGRISKGTPNTSTGTIKPSGAYTGAYASTVEIKISTAGAAGIAKYDWRMTTAGSTTVWTASTMAVATSTTPTALGTTGVSLAFSGNGTFNLNDIFYLYVRADLRAPVAAAMQGRTENGTMMCSSCHDQHLQAQAPFDPAASATYTAGVTNNRHFQRVANNAGGMCGDCHAKRDVGKGGTSHPVHVNRAAAPNTKAPSASLILNAAGNVECLTCHDIHKAPATTPVGHAATGEQLHGPMHRLPHPGRYHHRQCTHQSHQRHPVARRSVRRQHLPCLHPRRRPGRLQELPHPPRMARRQQPHPVLRRRLRRPPGQPVHDLP